MLSLYRRHRPRTFDSVVGQEHIVRTLRNAIELDKVHHAYLFVGSRGTGKTSMAKLLACALNAEGGARADFDPESPTAQAILTGTSLDVVEMDAASNNSVDDIRELRENVALAPMQGGRRVYILDEAHMLSTAAWNAFLKTLEEPPQHVVFVLATTEAHKVPATIIDRCHRFDFQRPSLEQIAGVLRRVAAEEGIADPRSRGGHARARRHRVVPRRARHARAARHLRRQRGEARRRARDPRRRRRRAGARGRRGARRARPARRRCSTVQQLSESGRDFTQFMRDLSAHLRHLFVVQTLGHVPDSFSVTAEHTDRLASQADRLSQGEILRAIDFLAAAIAAVKDGSEPRIQLEMALLKATQPQADLSLQALMFRIEQLERRAGRRAGRRAALDRAAPRPAPPACAAARRRWLPRPPWRPRRSSPRRSRSARSSSSRSVALWPAVAEAVAEENGMLGAALSRRDPDRARGRPAHRRLPGGRRVREEEGGAGSRPRCNRGARAHRPAADARLRAERGRGDARPRRRSTTIS